MSQVLEIIYQQAQVKNVQRERHMDDKSFPVGSWGRQGDIYIHRVPENHQHGAQTQNYQLAMGNTKGSRHVAMGETVKVFQGTTAPAGSSKEILLGPCVKSDVEFKIFHPEHAHVILPAGTYQITHQMDMATLQRVRD